LGLLLLLLKRLQWRLKIWCLNRLRVNVANVMVVNHLRLGHRIKHQWRIIYLYMWSWVRKVRVLILSNLIWLKNLSLLWSCLR
jgi:hypothetical protein